MNKKQLETLHLAIDIASMAHAEQLDKVGKPYIYHPMIVASNLDKYEDQVVAILHDTIEDTDMTKEKLEQYFPKNIVDSVLILTHDKKVTYSDYIDNIINSGDEVALRVKNADIKHNMSRTEYLKKDKSQYKQFKTLFVRYLSAQTKILKRVDELGLID